MKIKKNKIDKIILIAIALFAVIAIAFSIANAVKIKVNSETIKKTDICATPEGYSEESWKEHMSHHPDKYKECLTS